MMVMFHFSASATKTLGRYTWEVPLRNPYHTIRRSLPAPAGILKGTYTEPLADFSRIPRLYTPMEAVVCGVRCCPEHRPFERCGSSGFADA